MKKRYPKFRFADAVGRLKATLHTHKESLMRRIEYNRLKRIRRHSVPAYNYCKNCGEKLQGMYCSRCGQYALDPQQPFWKYIRQYFENVYQFDGKVWQTLFLLFRRPGLLTQEFAAGKINSYVHPLRLFMFLSALFFLYTFFIIPDADELNKSVSIQQQQASLHEYVQIQPQMALHGDDIPHEDIWMIMPPEGLGEMEQLLRIDRRQGDDTLLVHVPSYLISDGLLLATENDSVYWSCLDPRIPSEVLASRDRSDEIYNLRLRMEYNKIISMLGKWMPIIQLLLIPFFALLLSLFFRKRHLPYMTHFVQGLHLHSALLIMLFLFIAWIQLFGYSGRVTWLLILLFVAYMTVSFHRVYQNGWIRSFLKSVLLYSIYLVIFWPLLTIILLVLIAIWTGTLDDSFFMMFNRQPAG